MALKTTSIHRFIKHVSLLKVHHTAT